MSDVFFFKIFRIKKDKLRHVQRMANIDKLFFYEEQQQKLREKPFPIRRMTYSYLGL